MYKALTSFAGVISMGKGETRDISDKSLVEDLLQAGYIEEARKKQPDKKAAPKKVR